MVAELLKWLQGLGVGAVYALYSYLQSASAGDDIVAGLILAALVRLVGYLVSKLPAPAAR